MDMEKFLAVTIVVAAVVAAGYAAAGYANSKQEVKLPFQKACPGLS